MEAEFTSEAVLERVQFSGLCSQCWRLKPPVANRKYNPT
jgi:hypothetical protein